MHGDFIWQSKKHICRNRTVYVIFKNTSGLKAGNDDRLAGFNGGSIDNSSIINDSSAEISLQLQKSIRSYLKTGATISMGIDGLLCHKLILITRGRDHSALVKNGGE